MAQKDLHTIFEENLNSLMSNEQNHIPSMRYLSTCIGASSGYIQKILSNKNSPSFEKMQEIADHYDVEAWTLLCDLNGRSKQMLPIIQQINKCPTDMLPAIEAYIKFLSKQNGIPED